MLEVCIRGKGSFGFKLTKTKNLSLMLNLNILKSQTELVFELKLLKDYEAEIKELRLK